MKLYLSSQKLGNNVLELVELCWENKNVAVIANALDDKPNDYRTWRVKMEIEMLKSIWFEPEELDLKKYFGNPKALQDYLSKKSMVRIRWWSSFILNRAMIESGFNIVGVEMVKQNKIVYAWYSAALIVASMDLFGAEYVDDDKVIPGVYSKDVNPFYWLGFLDFYLIPHIDTKEEWAKNVPLHIAKLKENNKKVITLKDWEVLIINN